MSRILIVDDSRYTRESLRDILTEGGHEIADMAGNGLDAVELYKKEKPDIVTMDITMPELNGIEALKKIMEFDKDAKIVMITSLEKPDKVFESLNSGARHYITKPFEKGRVLKTISEVIGSGAASQE